MANEAKETKTATDAAAPVEPVVMPEMIEVTISVSDYPDEWDMTPAMFECWIVEKLKDAGVPIDGFLCFNGIKKGTLTRLDDPKDFGASKYIWKA